MKRVINGKTYSKVLGIKQGSLLTAGKDGDIEEYKADPTDAGKVLTVGEDGSVAPAEGGGGGGGDKLYAHNINGARNDYAVLWVQIITKSATPMTVADIINFLKDNSINFEGNAIPATGYLLNSYPDRLTYINGIFSLDNQLYAAYFNIMTSSIVSGNITRQASRGGTVITLRDQDITDVVYEIK